MSATDFSIKPTRATPRRETGQTPRWAAAAGRWLALLSLVLAGSPVAAAAAEVEPAPMIPVRLALQENRSEENLSICIGLNGGRPLPYLLDTGSDALFAPPVAWQTARRPSSPAIKTKVPEKIAYGNGTYGYTFFPVRAQVAFFNANFGVPALVLPCSAGYLVGRIVDEYTGDWPEKHQPMQRMPPTGPGVFSCRMFIAHGGDDTTGRYDLSNTLLQLPGVGGYVVTANGPPGTASLTVGLNRAIRRQFPEKISLTPLDDTFPGSHLHAHDESRVNVTFSQPGVAPVTFHAILGLDTGSSKGYQVGLTAADARAVAPYVFLSNAVARDRTATTSKSVKAGTTVTFSFPGRPDGLNYSFSCPQYATRNNFGPMTVTSEDAQESDVTAGIGFFEQFAVMYDIENGELGFRRTPPDLRPEVLRRP